MINGILGPTSVGNLHTGWWMEAHKQNLEESYAILCLSSSSALWTTSTPSRCNDIPWLKIGSFFNIIVVCNGAQQCQSTPQKKTKTTMTMSPKTENYLKKKRTNNTRTKAVCCFTPLSCLIHNSLVQAERPFLDAVQPPPPFQCFYQTRMQSHQRVK